MKMHFTLVLCASLIVTCAFSQQQVKVTDSLPYEINGLKIGYHILSTEEKQVSDKGLFSRYSIQWFVTNTSTEAKIILYKQGWAELGDASELVTFKCLNATGARFTTKEAIIQASPCTTLANVEDVDCDTKKTKVNHRFVQIGFWIKAGQTISTKGIVIVPLHELPDMQATLAFHPEVFGTTSMGSFQSNAQVTAPTGFVKLKSLASNTYINNEHGPVVTSPIVDGWWSAQWEFIPVPNTNYFLIKNRFKSFYLNNDANSAFSTFDDKALGSMWILEQANNSHAYTLRNAANNNYLNNENGSLHLSNNYGNVQHVTWVAEQ